MQHVAQIEGFGREFEIMSDEPDVLGGDNEYPTPLEYLAAAVGFCLLTQIERYGRMLKAEISASQCDVYISFEAEGSVLDGTIGSRCVLVETDVGIESGDPPELLAAVLLNADQGCYIRSLIRDPLEIRSGFRLNGDEFDLSDHSARPPRKGSGARS